MKLNVPFYSNTSDNTHCVQAALRMIMKYFWPGKDFSWKELGKITAKAKGKATWPFAGNIWLAEHGMKVKVIQSFDNQCFINEGVSYIKEFAGEEVAQWQNSHSDIKQERELAKESIKKIENETRIPTIEDIKEALDNGYLATCGINSKVLAEKDGYVSHRVVLTGYTDKGLYLHDPGLPPKENRFVPYELFEKAWAYPEEKMKNLTLFKDT